jgi:hypothetical protein
MGRKSMKLVDPSTGKMECKACGSVHFANIQSGLDRADGVSRYYRGSWQCSDERCPTNELIWDANKRRGVKRGYHPSMARNEGRQEPQA